MSSLALRKQTDRYAPLLGYIYRRARDRAVAGRAVPTPFGFTLAGEPRMASAAFEPEMVKVFGEMLCSCDAVIDVGANIGFYTCLAAVRGKPVIAFEPSPRNLSFLYKNIEGNQLSGVEVFPVGLARTPGLMRIYGFSDMSSFIKGWAQAQPSRYSTVPVTTLDTIAAGHMNEKKLLIKIDVEGFESDVLAGAQAVLDFDPRPVWIVEILLRSESIPDGRNDRFSETFEYFWKRGYSCCRLDCGRTPVAPTDVKRWVEDGLVDDDCANFIFS